MGNSRAKIEIRKAKFRYGVADQKLFCKKVKSDLLLSSTSQVAVVADDFPVEENVLHLRALADVVNDEVATGLWRFLVHDNSDVCDPAA